MDYNQNMNSQMPNQPKQSGSGFAIASMVLGILSIVFACCYGIGLVLAIIGLILGVLALKQQRPGKGMAIAGVVTSILGLLCGLFWVLIAVGIATSPEFLDGFMKGYDSSFKGF